VKFYTTKDHLEVEINVGFLQTGVFKLSGKKIVGKNKNSWKITKTLQKIKQENCISKL